MWFGTMSGLDRYDGNGFKIFKHDSKDSSSIDDDYISKISELPAGKLLIETRNGVNIYDPLTEKFNHDNSAYLTACHLPVAPIIQTVKNAQGNFYFLMAQQGLYKYNTAVHKSTKIADGGNPNYAITGCTKDTHGNLWLVRTTGVIEKIDGRTDKVIYSSNTLATSMQKELLNYYILVDHQAQLWLFAYGETRGVFHFDPATNRLEAINKETGIFRLNTNLVMGILEDDQDRIWICTDHGGVNILDTKNKSIQYVVNNPDDNNSLSQNSITAFYKDNNGIIWIGTYKRGIDFYHESIIKFPLYRHQVSNANSLPYDDVNRFVEDAKGNLWLGTNGGGLLYFDRVNGTFKQYLHNPNNLNSLSNDVIVSLCIDKQQRLWIGTYFGGLDRYDGNTFTHYKHNPVNDKSLADDKVWEIYQDAIGRLWVGTLAGGLDMFNEKDNTFKHYNVSIPNSIHSNYISDITENKEGDIWVGTSTGIDILEKKSGQIIHYDYDAKNSQGLSNGNVLCIHIDHKNRSWIGTREGLNLFDSQQKTFQHFTTENGLPDNTMLNILEDEKGNLWISTPNGISHVTLLPGERVGTVKISCENYTESDGLQSIQFNENAALTTSKGELVFGGPNGFNIFQPQNIIHSKQATALVFTGFQLFNKNVEAGETINGKVLLPQAITQTKSITLNYDQNVISIAFTDLNFTGTDKTKYAYMLEGFNNKWLMADGKTRQAVFTNLDPGNYTFRVKKVDENRSTEAHEIWLQIEILPPFWKTPLAYILYFMIVVIALYIGRIMIINKAKTRFAIDQERKEAQQLHELDLMKIKFFTNVSHEFRTPLSLILAPLDKMLRQANQPTQKNQLQLIYRNAKRLLNLVNQLLDFRKMEEKELKLQATPGNIIRYIDDTAHFFSDVADKKNISFSFHANIDHLEAIFDHDKIERILFNVLSNAFKFTPEHGHVGVEVQATAMEDNAETYQLSIKIVDTGIGIHPEKQEKIFERFFQNDIPGSMVNQGSGIGLSITKEFVKLHGGTITVESEPGKGSCFTIELQVQAISVSHFQNNNIVEIDELLQHDSQLLPTASAYENSVEDETLKTDHKKPSLLLIEDNDDFRYYLKDNLKPFFNIVEAIDGKQGWQKTLAAHPDLVVSDISMPEMNGIDLCKKIKTDKRTSHIPVILLTALTGEEQQLQGLETGANDYMTKPFNFEILLSKIRNQLTQQAQSKKTYQKQVEAKPTDVAVESPNEKFMQQLLAAIEKKISDADYSVEDMSREMFMSRVSLYKKVLSLTGKTPIEFLRQLRLKRAAQLFEKSKMTVAEVAYEVGFNNPKYFAKYFKQEFGTLPSAYIHKKRQVE